ncbi:helix-turn-helix domain-containing protein [Dictyobacter formicarum]|uniref:HTH cro/C1-type domain-containing protein n=1 Tax=Dictyobacter formicarum TaxID=2778368 RepID=A0ABQ3V8J4_9CHLR|nr:tetratricopeptide repeat protein [Dictyobacter formicarum]GHO82452.1 hypothetical protein KSZ_04580 [Dictyobacter formicarum]
MKKSRTTTLNLHLRNERELRGWTRSYVAEKLGLADPKTVGRWERGVSSPNAYFRQKLCGLFEKTAQDLGLLQPMVDIQHEQGVDSPSAIQNQNTPPAIPTSFLYDPATPSIAAGTVKIIGSEKWLQHLKSLLCSSRHPTYISLHGLPGVGKTTLAIELAHDHEIQTHFHDGVLWARVGPKPDIMGLLSRWGTLVGLPAALMNNLTTCEDWIEAIRTAINTRRILFIIDDVWKIEDALNFKIGGPNCAHLITTRFPDVALQFSPGESILLPELNIDDGLALLACFVPDLVAAELPATRKLVQLVGGLPLALTIMGKYLQRQAYSGQPRRVETALERLYNTEERLQLKELQSSLERSPSLPAETPLSLQAVIGASDNQLENDARNTLYALSIFPAKPNSFSEQAALAVGDTSTETLDTLIDAGLLESYGPGRYTLHQTIVDYAKTQQKDRRVEERLVTYMLNYIQRHEMNYDVLQLENANILTAMEIAYEMQMQEELVQISCAIAPFLYMRGSDTLAEEHLTRAYVTAMAHRDNRGVIKTLLHLGEIMRKRGEYRQTEAYLQDGLNLARQLEDTKLINILLERLSAIILAIVIELQGNYVQAETYYLEELTLARQHHLHGQISRLLTDLGVLTGQQGNYTQAEAYLKEALAIVRQQDLRETETTTFAALGWVVAEQGNYQQAEAYLQEGLMLARQIRNRERYVSLLWALGMTEIDQGNYAQAKTHLQEGLELARQLTHRELISELLLKLGRVATDQGDYTQAETYLQEGLSVTRRIGHNKLIGDLLQHLSIVAAKRGKDAQVDAYIQEGLTVARQVGHRELLCTLLLQLGERAIVQEDYNQAEEHLQTALSIARQISHRKRISMVLACLSMQAIKCGNYGQAKIYLADGLTLARQLNLPHLICTLLYHKGECQLKQQQSSAAAANFREMLSSSPKGCQELIASARYGLARVAALQKNFAEAQQQGHSSLSLFEKIGHHSSNEVRSWLDTLPPLTNHIIEQQHLNSVGML